MILKRYRPHLVTLSLIVVAPNSFAGYVMGGPCVDSGTIYESSLVPADFVANISDPSGNTVLSVPLTGTLGSDGLYHASLSVPCLPGWDVSNDTYAKVPGHGPGNPGGGTITTSAHLAIESYFINKQGQYQLLPIFDTIDALRGGVAKYYHTRFLHNRCER